ncbi:MAG: dTDP-glucose 4,6-dehydratase [Candidatus Zixiibacteriota bacterium]
MRFLITGGCGFLGSHVTRACLGLDPQLTIVNADCLTYAGSLDNLGEAANDPRHTHAKVDISDAESFAALWTDPFDLVLHFAAETHVDRSLEDAARFVRTNVLGTQMVLEMALRQKERHGTLCPVIVISTDEVYGPATKGQMFGIGDPLRPTSPYAASKASADWLALSYARTFGLDVTIIRSVNVYGPRQYPEKVIPLFTTRALTGEPLPLYGSGRQRRCWLYVDDYVSGIMRILSDHQLRQERPIWHLGSPHETDNYSLARMICDACGADPALITMVPDRPGHDLRYALDFSQTARVFGWQPAIDMAEGLKRTVAWIRQNRDWCLARSQWAPPFLRRN